MDTLTSSTAPITLSVDDVEFHCRCTTTGDAQVASFSN
jgi:hypothetical protein